MWLVTVVFDVLYLAVVVLVAEFTPFPPLSGSMDPSKAGSVTNLSTPAPMPATTKAELMPNAVPKPLNVAPSPGLIGSGAPVPVIGSGNVE